MEEREQKALVVLETDLLAEVAAATPSVSLRLAEIEQKMAELARERVELLQLRAQVMAEIDEVRQRVALLVHSEKQFTDFKEYRRYVIDQAYAGEGCHKGPFALGYCVICGLREGRG